MHRTSASKARYAHHPYVGCIKPKDVGSRGSRRRLDAGADAMFFEKLRNHVRRRFVKGISRADAQYRLSLSPIGS